MAKPTASPLNLPTWAVTLGGENADDVLTYLARTLTNKLMHQPSATLRKARGAHQQELLSSARHLFQLDSETHAEKRRNPLSKTNIEDNE